jgi:hypothetical protein
VVRHRTVPRSAEASTSRRLARNTFEQTETILFAPSFTQEAGKSRQWVANSVRPSR